MDSVLLIVALGAVAAGFVQGLSGFGFGMVAMSFWAWALEPRLAALLAVQIMAVSDAELAQKLDEARTRERDAVLRADEEVRALYQ